MTKVSIIKSMATGSPAPSSISITLHNFTLEPKRQKLVALRMVKSSNPLLLHYCSIGHNKKILWLHNL